MSTRISVVRESSHSKRGLRLCVVALALFTWFALLGAGVIGTRAAQRQFLPGRLQKGDTRLTSVSADSYDPSSISAP